MLVIFLFLFFSSLYGEELTSSFSGLNTEETKSILTDIGSEPSAIVAGCVNVISGNFTDHEVDLTLPGPEPFNFSRSYCSNDTSDSLFLRHWHNNHQEYIHMNIQSIKHEKDFLVDAFGKFGSRTYFHDKGSKTTPSYYSPPRGEMYKSGLTNIAQGVISAQNNVANLRLQFDCSNRSECLLVDGGGEVHKYKEIKETKDDHYGFSKDGVFRNYYRLSSLHKPSGMKFELSYEKATTKLQSVTLKNRSNVAIGALNLSQREFKTDVKNLVTEVKAPDGRFVAYHMHQFGKKDAWILKQVERSDGPRITYDYEDGEYTYGKLGEFKGHVERISRKNKPDGRFLAIEYYDTGKNVIPAVTIDIDSRSSKTYNRVKQILAPCGPDHKPQALYSFNYCVSEASPQWGTGVYDALGNQIDYYFNRNNQLESILKFDKQKNPYTREQLYWWDKQGPKGICIKTRCFGVFGAASKTYARSYFYDDKGNLTTDALYGNIRGVNRSPVVVDEGGNVHLTGSDVKVKQCTYTNDSLNLLASVTEGERTQTFAYVPGSNLISCCHYWNTTGIYARTFYQYDDNAMVVKMISDNGCLYDPSDLTGVTVRAIEYTKRTSSYPTGLPLEVKKMYVDPATRLEHLICREVNQFDPQGRMIEKCVYDANDAFAYSQSWTYNAWGNLLVETNPLGASIVRSYDSNGNMIKEEGPLPDTFKSYTYDFSNRLIRMDEHHPDCVLSQHFKYDLMGHKIASIDAFGHQTDYVYDAFGRVLLEEAPLNYSDETSFRPTTQYAYDELSNPIAITDPKGNVTKAAYTLFGKPYRIEYPDGSIEHFEYDLENQLIKEISKNGSITLNSYDYQGRITKKEITDSEGTLLAAQEWGYNSLHLLYEKDPAGNVTEYGYDAQGRKISITKGMSRTDIEYDSLGRVIKTIYDGTVKTVKYDVLNQIIEELEEDTSGTILKCTFYKYDAIGRKIATTTGTGDCFYCAFDTHGTPVETIDQEGNVSKAFGDYHFINRHGQRVYRLESIDPKGVVTTTIHDTRGKPVEVSIRNAYGTLLHTRHYGYDINGNKIKVTEVPHLEGVALEPQKYCFEYDIFNRPTAIIQAAGSCLEKRTQNSYNLFGEKVTTIKPDGQELHYSYDAMGRLTDYFNSERTIHYRYCYDLNSNPTHIADLVNGTTTERTYDGFNNITSEKLQNNLKTDFIYAPDGKILSLTLPDKSSVRYSYQGSFLKTIERLSSHGTVRYSHFYDSYDQSGRLCKEVPFYDIGTLHYSYSPKGHLLEAHSPYFTEKGEGYDTDGNLLKRTIFDLQGTLDEAFAYDDLGQLKNEKGTKTHSYTYDSLNNRLSQDGSVHAVNVLNQLLQDKDNSYSYDLSGNLTEKLTPQGITHYSYDALDRLIQVQTPTTAFSYTYDELNRCMTSTQDGEAPLRLLYLTQAEMGACNVKGEITQLQVLGLGRRTEPCAAAVIELDSIPYAVFRDQSGHVRALVDQEGCTAMSYRYSAFGILESYANGQGLNNPWTVAGKRYQPETGLVFFGRRFYEPATGRWITQDPAGLEAGPNLYAYLNNSPLVHYDAYGLFENNFSYYNVREGASNLVSNVCSGALYVVRTLGNFLYKLSWNLIPLPALKDIPMAAGHFLMHGTLKNYTMTYNMPKSQVLTAGEGHREGVGHCSGNGLGNTLENGQEFAQSDSDAHGGERVYHAYLSQNGIISDLGQVGLQKLGVRTEHVSVVEQVIYLASRDAGGPGKGHYITADFHSRGGTTLACARSYISEGTEKMLFIGTYGTATIAKKGGAARVMNYMSSTDPIPFIASPVGYLNARIFGDSTVTFLPSKEGWFDHSFQGATYQDALRDSANRFNDFLKDKKWAA